MDLGRPHRPSPWCHGLEGQTPLALVDCYCPLAAANGGSGWWLLRGASRSPNLLAAVIIILLLLRPPLVHAANVQRPQSGPHSWRQVLVAARVDEVGRRLGGQVPEPGLLLGQNLAPRQVPLHRLAQHAEDVVVREDGDPSRGGSPVKADTAPLRLLLLLLLLLLLGNLRQGREGHVVAHVV